jgi:hypothetical protein
VVEDFSVQHGDVGVAVCLFGFNGVVDYVGDGDVSYGEGCGCQSYEEFEGGIKEIFYFTFLFFPIK